MIDSYKTFSKQLDSTRLLFDEPLSKHTYFKVGGPADLFLEADSSSLIIRAASLARTLHIPYMVIGGGSNILVTDKGYRGLIIKNKTNGLSLKGFSGSINKTGFGVDKVLVYSESGVPSNKLIRFTLDEGLSGLEDFLGLPGTVGGAIYNNSHHLGKLIGDLVKEVEVLDTKAEIKKYTKSEMKFDYDYSILHKTKEIVLSATFLLEKGDKDALWKQATSAVKRRSDTQPLGLPSSGCVFKNIKLSDAMRIGTPDHTCSSGYLIDKAGLKGQKVGGAYVSDKHANFIINDGTATSQDVLELIKLIKNKVKDKYSTTLELEIFVVGEK